jgi:hypothetical protein
VHLQNSTDPFLFALDRVHDRVARVQHAGVNPEKRQVAHERVGGNLERECRERFVVIRVPFAVLAVVINTHDRGYIDR